MSIEVKNSPSSAVDLLPFLVVSLSRDDFETILGPLAYPDQFLYSAETVC